PSGQQPAGVRTGGRGPRAQALCRALSEPDRSSTSHVRLVGDVDSNQGMTAPAVRQQLLGTLDVLDTVLMRTVVDEVLIALPIKSCYQQIQDVIHTCERLGVQS